MRVLVTGDAGYIGTVMMSVLRREGHDVVGFDTGYFSACTLYDEAAPDPQIRRDLRAVAPEDLAGFEAVVHLAALSNDPLGDLSPQLTHDINCVGSLRLAELANAAGVRRFLFASSCSMYGASSTDALLAEDAPLNPLTPYAESKVRFEQDLSTLASDRFSPVYLRNATAYGVSAHQRVDVVLNNLVGWAYTTGKVRILSDGTPWRPIVHVEDICRTFAMMLTAPVELVHNRAFNVGQSTENYQVRDLAEIVRDTVPGCEVEYAGTGGPDPRNYRVDFSRLSATFPSFRLLWDARLGARQLYDAYRAAGLTLDDLVGRKFIRLSQLKHLIADGSLDETLHWKHSQSSPALSGR